MKFISGAKNIASHSALPTLSKRRPPRSIIWGGCLGLLLLWHSPLILQVFSFNDSFFNLSFIQRSGLIVYSAILIFVLCILSDIKTSWFVNNIRTTAIAFVLDITITIGFFLVLYKLSPQLYYLYYQFLFPDLPVQWVVNFELSFPAQLLLKSINTLSELLAGLTLWWLVLMVICRYGFIALSGRLR